MSEIVSKTGRKTGAMTRDSWERKGVEDREERRKKKDREIVRGEGCAILFIQAAVPCNLYKTVIMLSAADTHCQRR